MTWLGGVIVGLGLLAVGCETPVSGRVEPPPLDLSDMETVDGTSFAMGHEEATPGPYGAEWKENELPQHAVEVSTFVIDRTEVTVDQWVVFLNSDGAPHYHPLQDVHWVRDAASGSLIFEAAEGAGQLPIAQVSWFDAVVFCRWSGKRLPKEAEWELAAKGQGMDRYPWGPDRATCDHSVFTTSAAPCNDSRQVVGSRSPLGDSPHGLADMAGNVAEWVFDRYGAYEEDAQEDPVGPDSGDQRVLRGGGFRERAASIRTTSRWGALPDERSDGVGFRCAGDP